jgi:hypothetical protein
MTINEIIQILSIPSTLKEIAIVAVVLSLVEISPLKVNPWKWIKAFISIPSRLNDLENMIERDKAHRWRTQILHFADSVRRKQTASKETWDDVIDSIDHYNLYCKTHEDFRNGKTTAATTFLNKVYAEALESGEGFLD